jgi:hypothetical protein
MQGCMSAWPFALEYIKFVAGGDGSEVSHEALVELLYILLVEKRPGKGTTLN